MLAMTGGAAQLGVIENLSEDLHPNPAAFACRLREDGAYVEEGENDAVIVHKLEKYPDALGIFGFSFLVRNKDRLQGARIDGIAPTAAGIASGRYPLSRPLYIYVKKAHVDRIPGIHGYLELFTSEEMGGPNGTLAANGLVPMTDAERTHYWEVVRQLPVLVLD